MAPQNADYDSMKVDDLKTLMGERKLLIPDGAKKADLVAILEKDDASEGNSEDASADAEIVEPEEGDAPKEGEALNLSGDEIAQIGKHPDLPADIPVQAGTALDPALPPLEPQQTRTEPEE